MSRECHLLGGPERQRRSPEQVALPTRAAEVQAGQRGWDLDHDDPNPLSEPVVVTVDVT